MPVGTDGAVAKCLFLLFPAVRGRPIGVGDLYPGWATDHPGAPNPTLAQGKTMRGGGIIQLQTVHWQGNRSRDKTHGHREVTQVTRRD